MKTDKARTTKSETTAKQKGGNEMNISMKEKRAEAIVRMELLGYDKEVIEMFKRQRRPIISAQPLKVPFGVDDDELAIARSIEDYFHVLVYAVLRSPIGAEDVAKIDAYICVSDDRSEWATERECLQKGEAVALEICWVKMGTEIESVDFVLANFIRLPGGVLWRTR
jgi:hypothetical protein